MDLPVVPEVYSSSAGSSEVVAGSDAGATRPSSQPSSSTDTTGVPVRASMPTILTGAWCDALAEKKLSAQMLLQVHDELIFEVPDDEVANTLPVIQHVMQDAPFPAVSLSVPLQVDARAAGNWDEAH